MYGAYKFYFSDAMDQWGQTMNSKGVKSWSMLIGKHLVCQSAVRAINLFVGMVILWQLPLGEYALYTVAGLLLVVTSLGSDLGFTQAVNTIGARLCGDKQRIGVLFSSAYYYQKILLLFTSAAMAFMAAFMLFGHEWEVSEVIITLVLVLLTSWAQLPLNLRRTILNIHHDSDSLFLAGASEAIVRLILVSACFVLPSANIALGINLVGVLVARVLLARKCGHLIEDNLDRDMNQCAELKAFVIPLVPIMIYYAFQNQISIFILGLLGNTVSIAEVGALGRLGQIIVVLHLIFPFFLQPYFARMNDRYVFIRGVVRLSGVLILISILGMLSAYLVPELWLFILGENYSNLTDELPIAMMTALQILAGGAIYTVVISRSVTSGQSWAVAVGLFSQIFYVLIYGVDSTYNALVLNMLPGIGYLLVQIALLTAVMRAWKGQWSK